MPNLIRLLISYLIAITKLVTVRSKLVIIRSKITLPIRATNL
jgi:hypothetical protein